MATSMELAHTAEMACASNMRSAEMTASSVESSAATDMTAAKMRATTAAAAHMNAAAMSSASATRSRVGRYRQSCQESKRHNGDFEKVSHGFTPRVKIIMCKHINVESS